MPNGNATPVEIQDWVAEAWAESLLEFSRCSGEAPEGEVLDKLKEIFDKTIRRGIEEGGVAWEEPIRSYGLRHVCKIANRWKRCGGCDLAADDLDDAADQVIDTARKSCKSLAKKGKMNKGEIGVLCPA